MAKQPDRMKAAKIYVNGTMVGVAESASYKINGNDEAHMTADGQMIFGDGATTTDITINSIVTLPGRTAFLTQAILDKAYLTVQVYPIEGKTHQIEGMRCLSASYDTDNKTGSLKGSFTFQGGQPQIV